MPKAFKVNSSAIRKLLRSPGAQRATDMKAAQVAAIAQSIAPVASGDYRASITPKADPTPNRARSEVRSDVDYALIVEARDHVLLRALNAVRE